ncbi:MAG: hypothetical protein QM490_04110 [Candidatus Gracilibacteria bacterium]
MSIEESIIGDDGYNEKVVGLGDKVSGNFLEACNKAIEKLTIRNLLEKKGNSRRVKTGVPIAPHDCENQISSVTESIDGVGTKIQIYSEVFNSLVEDFDGSLVSNKKIMEISIELWERMLRDLIAMNIDDLREGEMAIVVTNIIDINHLEGPRGNFFAESMKFALYNVSTELDIGITAGETAVLGENDKVPKILCDVTEPQRLAGVTSTAILDIMLGDERIKKLLYENEELNDYLDNYVSKNKSLLKSTCKNTFGKIREIIDRSFETYENSQKILEVILRDISFNIGGTGLGIIGNDEKLTEIKAGQAIMYFEEVPTENGIIGPRSNGITRIRTAMNKLAGTGWEILTFEEFLDKIGNNLSSKLPQKLKDECSGLKMWDIATGKTTIYNPFISRVLLGGLNNKPIINASSLMHVTGNPGRKISDGLKGNKNLAVELDISDIKIPQIIEILQILGSITGKDAIGSWNMGVSYAIICDESDIETTVNEAKANGFVAKRIGTVVERENEDIVGVIKGVGVHNEEIEIKAEK